MIRLDTKKLHTQYSDAIYEICYCIYYDDRETEKIKVKVDGRKVIFKNIPNECIFFNNVACFSGFIRRFIEFTDEKGKRPNKLTYFCDFKKHSCKKIHLDESMIKWWVNTCQKVGLIPKNFEKNRFIQTGIFTIDISKINITALYATLTAVRYLSEAPQYIRALNYLIDELGLDFFESIVVASHTTINGFGHHLIPVTSVYPPINESASILKNISMEFRYAKGLRKFCDQLLNNKFDEKEFLINKKHLKDLNFNMHSTIRSLSADDAESGTKFKFDDLNSPKLRDYIYN